MAPDEQSIESAVATFHCAWAAAVLAYPAQVSLFHWLFPRRALKAALADAEADNPGNSYNCEMAKDLFYARRFIWTAAALVLLFTLL